jgi:hypothetical protein
MTHIDLFARAILEYAERGELQLVAGLVTHRGDALDLNSGQAVVDLIDLGALSEVGDLIVPTTVTDTAIAAVLSGHIPS